MGYIILLRIFIHNKMKLISHYDGDYSTKDSTS